MTIKENSNLLDALKIINKNSTKTIFLESESDKIVASLSDGDIRRHLIKSRDLSVKISKIANYSFSYIAQDEVSQAKTIMLSKKINCLPVLDNKKRLISIIFLEDFYKIKTFLTKKKKLNIPVVIMAGGEGTRLKPYSDVLPKPLIPVGDVTITERIIERFLAFGAKDFTMIVGHKRNLVKAYFDGIKKKYDLKFIDEPKPLKTGGGLAFLKSQIKETFFLTNCDIIVDEDYEKLYKKHKKEKNIITLVCAQKNFILPYGAIETNSKDDILSFKEKPEIKFITNTGLYIIEPEFLELVPKGEPIDITDIIKSCIKLDKKIGVSKVSDESWHDMGQCEELEKMIDFFG